MKDRMKIGIVAGSFKPFHNGHYSLIKRASIENDTVTILTSSSDRIRKNEHPILGSDMILIWNQHLSKIMPSNANVEFISSPIRRVYEILGESNLDDQSNDIFTIYADDKDNLENFPIASRVKYFGKLSSDKRVNFISIERKEETAISGTKMREYLAKNQKEKFINFLPFEIDRDDVWNMLRKGKL